MEEFSKTSLAKWLLFIAAVMGVTTALYLNGAFNAGGFIVAVIACLPAFKWLWHYAQRMHYDTVRRLIKRLPKAGFKIMDTKWSDDGTTVHFNGTYQGDHFKVNAIVGCAYVEFNDLPWYEVDAADPLITRVLEAINDVNERMPNISVVMKEPNKDGKRIIYTRGLTILPTHRTEVYIESLMCDMLNRKRAFFEAFHKERPYMSYRRTPVGFNVPEASDQTQDAMAPAAKA